MIRVNSQSFSLSSTLKKRSNHDDVNERISITKSQTLPLQPIYQKSVPENLKIQYVTQRILASVLPRRESPAGGKGVTQEPDRHEREVIAMLEHKHGKHYRVFDLESCITLVTLERICELCKHIDVWLGTTPENVVVLQDREGSQRLGTAIAAYLEYLDLCVANCHKRKGISNEDVRASNAIAKNWLDLDIISLKKFLSVSIGPLRIPSNRRYITYFSGLLSGQIKLNAEPIYLKYINVISPPTWLQQSSQQQQQQRNGAIGQNAASSSHNQGEWNSFVKIYEGLQCVYTSDIHIIPITTRQFLFELGNLRLRGDILIRCYQVLTSGDSNNLNIQDTRELLYSIQFHTCAIKTNEFTFTKEEMDYAWQDSRFPKDFRVSFHLTSDPANPNNQQPNGYIFQSPLVRTVAPTDLAKANSIENINLEALLGPVDGSLYATILKSPTKSKGDTPLLSPPPQFSNNHHHNGNTEVIERQPLSSSTPVRNSYSSGSHQRSYSSSTTSQSTVREVSVPPRTSSLISSATTTPDYCYLENQHPPRSSTSQSNYSQNPVIITEIISNGQNGVNGNRESVKSPLTLSMDSGISSNCLNRPLARSSVSPLSFPSQNSPQDDRQRELDDILSDMLMTVNEIPDFRKKHHTTTSTTTTTTQKLQRSQSVIPGQSAQYLQVALPTASSSNTLNRNHRSQTHENISLQHQVSRELLYDTASTATTITPPASESGRETPHQLQLQLHHQQQSSNILPATITTRQKRETFGGMASQSQTSNRSLSIQSLNYPQTVRSSATVPTAANNSNRISNNSTTEDEDNIPYHAREHSQPFSYGNILPNGEPDPRMIKAQTGLTSPTLVRKAFNNRLSSTSSTSNLSYNSASTMRKNQIDSDFEDMLRERREKYSISDKPRSNGYQSQQPQQQTYYTTTETLRRSHQPLLDRSMSSEEISLQSWLALQQEKLRAKKEQQFKTHERKYMDEIHTEIRSRPQRSRNVVRYDGYQSDTAAFASDDVDFRRPLHIQTPSARSPERYHNTFTKTSVTTTSKERPHVGVQRAHKMDQALSPTLSPLDILKASPPTGHVTQTHLQKTITNSSNLNNSNNHSSSLVSVNSSNQNNGLLSMAESPKVQRNGQMRLMREESFSSYRSETEPELSMAGSPSRPETPGFPVTPRTPYGFSNGSISPALPPKSPNSQRKDLSSGMQRGNIHDFMNSNDTITQYARRNSNASSEPQEVAPHYVKFVRDSSKYWYKPTISREEAINLLRHSSPGTFIVRDSTTFKNAYGLVLRVAHPPQGVVAKPGSDELVRHFLVEPTSRGVRLKGCPNEPVFTSLSALVYQHSITPLALPCRLNIPDRDIAQIEHTPAQKQLLAQGAACNVLYLFSCETESLTGEEAVRRAVRQLYSQNPLPKPIEVHFKVSQQGITLTDNTRQKFFRKHYNPNMVSFCGLDPDNSMWSVPSSSGNVAIAKKSVFAFVARRTPTSVDNMCHVFCDLQPNQPSTAIVSFVNKVLPTEKSINFNI